MGKANAEASLCSSLPAEYMPASDYYRDLAFDGRLALLPMQYPDILSSSCTRGR